MTSTQYNILIRFGQFSRNLQFFTGGTNNKPGDLAMSSPVAQANLNTLMSLGMIRPVDNDTYRITAAGRRYLDEKGKEQADYSRIPTGAYTPPAWPVREGGNDHLAISSRGMI